MKDKDRDACIQEFNLSGFNKKCEPYFAYTAGWQAALDYARKEREELLEKCNSVLGMVYHIDDVDDDSVIEITANAKELILELNSIGIKTPCWTEEELLAADKEAERLNAIEYD